MLHKKDKWEVVALDQGLTPITHPEGFEKYANKTTTYITKLITHPEKEAAETKAVRELMRGHSRYDIEVTGSLEIQHGVVEAVRGLAALSAEDVRQMKQHIQSLITSDVSNVWERGMQGVDVEFIISVIQIFRDCLAKQE